MYTIPIILKQEKCCENDGINPWISRQQDGGQPVVIKRKEGSSMKSAGLKSPLESDCQKLELRFRRSIPRYKILAHILSDVFSFYGNTKNRKISKENCGVLNSSKLTEKNFPDSGLILN